MQRSNAKVHIDSGELLCQCRLGGTAVASIKGMKIGLTPVLKRNGSCCIALRRDGKHHHECRAAAYSRLHADRPSEHRFRNLLHDREPDAGPLPWRFRGEAAIEDPRNMLWSDPVTSVAHCEAQAIASA